MCFCRLCFSFRDNSVTKIRGKFGLEMAPFTRVIKQTQRIQHSAVAARNFTVSQIRLTLYLKLKMNYQGMNVFGCF